MPKLKLHFQRFEIKYQIPLDIVEGLLPEFLKYMDFDPYAKDLPNQAYRVASLYYDSVGLDCYYQKLAGIKTRKKIRIRFYPNTNDFSLQPDKMVFMEIKRKYDMVVVKDRLAINHQNCYDLLTNHKKSNLSFNQNEQVTLDEFLWLKLYNSMLPQNMVIYERKPLISKIDPNFRVTIDYNLQTFSSDWLALKNGAWLVNPNGAVLEVKFNNLMPFWFQNILQRYGLEHQPFSKYCSSLETCRPELAAKKFIEIYQPQLISKYN